MPFSRYRDMIPDWEAFEATRFTPEPTTIRVRRGKISAEELLPRLTAQGFRLAPVEGIADFYRLEDGPFSIAQTLEYWLGLFHIQQAVMALPSLALSPRPGDRVLDLCAAPGGKTAHMAELMEDRGALVAVDPKEKRLRALLANIYRLGHSNVLVIAGDGRQISVSAEFDRVLVDAPCSAEGTFRRQEGKVPKRSASFVAHITAAQEALLRRGIALTRPGGSILYSTCTFAPEENEAIVNQVLIEGAVAIEEIRLGLPHSPGLTEWKGEPFHPDLRHAWRIYPHQLNAGGLFMALLRKLPGGGNPLATSGTGVKALAERPSRGWGPVPPAFPGDDPAAAESRIERSLSELESLYGFKKEGLAQLGWMVRRENIWTHTAQEWPMPGWESDHKANRWRVVSLGLRALRDRGAREGITGLATPSSHFLARFGRQMGDNRQFHLSDSEIRTLLEGELLSTEGISPGAVVLLWRGMILGRGMIRGTGYLVSEIADAQANRLREILGGYSPRT